MDHKSRSYMKAYDLTDRVAIVTGSARGIGRSITLALAEAGADVAVVDIDVAGADDTRKAIAAMGAKALALGADVRHSEDVQNMVARTKEEFGRIDILVNNVGLFPTGTPLNSPFWEMSESDWDDIVARNLKSTFLCTKEVTPIMVSQKSGNIINMALSTFESTPWPQDRYKQEGSGKISAGNGCPEYLLAA